MEAVHLTMNVRYFVLAMRTRGNILTRVIRPQSGRLERSPSLGSRSVRCPDRRHHAMTVSSTAPVRLSPLVLVGPDAKAPV